MQGHPGSTKLTQILDTDSRRIDFHPARLRCWFIIELKLQLMIERLLTAMLGIPRSRQLCLFGSAKNSEPPGFIKLTKPGESWQTTRVGKVKVNLRCPARGDLLFASRRLSNRKRGQQFVEHSRTVSFVGVQRPVSVVGIDDSQVSFVQM